MDSYSYKPLDLQKATVRLLRLKSSRDFRSQISCEIFEHALDHLYPYEALSYRWEEGAQNSIELDGKDFRVSSTLDAALRRLREAQRDRILWIDAICIHQSDIHERNHQVQQMDRIYREAFRVIIWLGNFPSRQASDLFKALQLIDYKAIEAKVEMSDIKKSSSWVMSTWRDLQENRHLPDAFWGIRMQWGVQELLKKAWFERIWIVQEVALSRSAIICCGRSTISTQTFALAPWLLGMDVREFPVHVGSVLEIMPGRRKQATSWWTQQRSFSMMLRKFASSKATEPRDKIYALLKLSDQERDHNFAVDYRKPTIEVYRDALLHILHGQHTSWTELADLLSALQLDCILVLGPANIPIQSNALVIPRVACLRKRSTPSEILKMLSGSTFKPSQYTHSAKGYDYLLLYHRTQLQESNDSVNSLQEERDSQWSIPVRSLSNHDVKSYERFQGPIILRGHWGISWVGIWHVPSVTELRLDWTPVPMCSDTDNFYLLAEFLMVLMDNGVRMRLMSLNWLAAVAAILTQTGQEAKARSLLQSSGLLKDHKALGDAIVRMIEVQLESIRGVPAFIPEYLAFGKRFDAHFDSSAREALFVDIVSLKCVCDAEDSCDFVHELVDLIMVLLAHGFPDNFHQLEAVVRALTAEEPEFCGGRIKLLALAQSGVSNCLIEAIRRDWRGTCFTLIKQGFDVNVYSTEDGNALWMARQKRWDDLIELLINYGALEEKSPCPQRQSWTNYISSWKETLKLPLLNRARPYVLSRHRIDAVMRTGVAWSTQVRNGNLTFYQSFIRHLLKHDDR